MISGCSPLPALATTMSGPKSIGIFCAIMKPIDAGAFSAVPGGCDFSQSTHCLLRRVTITSSTTAGAGGLDIFWRAVGNEDAVAGQGVRERQGGDGVFGSAESGINSSGTLSGSSTCKEIEGEPFRRLVSVCTC